MHIYFAGPLFTQAERHWNAEVAQQLIEAGHTVFLPQSEVKGIATLDADTVFRTDVNGVRSAEVLIAVLDGADPDSGTSFECGIAYTLGIPIIAVRTDFRGGGDALPGQRVGTINLMLSQAATEVVHLDDPVHAPGAVANALIAAIEALRSQPAPLALSRTEVQRRHG